MDSISDYKLYKGGWVERTKPPHLARELSRESAQVLLHRGAIL